MATTGKAQQHNSTTAERYSRLNKPMLDYSVHEQQQQKQGGRGIREAQVAYHYAR